MCAKQLQSLLLEGPGHVMIGLSRLRQIISTRYFVMTSMVYYLQPEAPLKIIPSCDVNVQV